MATSAKGLSTLGNRATARFCLTWEIFAKPGLFRAALSLKRPTNPRLAERVTRCAPLACSVAERDAHGVTRPYPLQLRLIESMPGGAQHVADFVADEFFDLGASGAQVLARVKL